MFKFLKESSYKYLLDRYLGLLVSNLYQMMFKQNVVALVVGLLSKKVGLKIKKSPIIKIYIENI